MTNFERGINNPITFFLFARPSFLEGIARMMDFGSSLNIYNESKTPEEADSMAILNDWYAVGQDMQAGIRKYERTIKTNPTKK